MAPGEGRSPPLSLETVRLGDEIRQHRHIVLAAARADRLCNEFRTAAPTGLAAPAAMA